MNHWTTKEISPATVWFWFLQSLIGIFVVCYWFDAVVHFDRWRTFGNPFILYGTVLFIISNVLLFRFRVLGVLGSIVSWFLIAALGATL